MSFVTVFAGGIALNNVGPLIWIWMLLSCAIAVPFVYFMCPEVSRTLQLLTYVSLDQKRLAVLTILDDGQDPRRDRHDLRKERATRFSGCAADDSSSKCWGEES